MGSGALMPRTSTFSIVAFDPAADELGVAVQSKFIAVGAVVPWLETGVGAIATQALANTSYGPRGLALLRSGAEPNEVIKALAADDSQAEHRQVGIVDAQGNAATYTGAACMPWAGGSTGPNFAAQGNILVGPQVVEALERTFTNGAGSLADRLVAALRAAQTAGGDRRGKQSAALIVVKPGAGYGGFNDRYVDLRVDDHPEPIEELARVLELYKVYFFKPEPEDIIDIDASVGREIVRSLQRLGELAPSVSTFDATASAALKAFMHRENLEERLRTDGRIDKQTLNYLRTFGT